MADWGHNTSPFLRFFAFESSRYMSCVNLRVPPCERPIPAWIYCVDGRESFSGSYLLFAAFHRMMEPNDGLLIDRHFGYPSGILKLTHTMTKNNVFLNLLLKIQALSKILNAQQTDPQFQSKSPHQISKAELVYKNHYYDLNYQYIKPLSGIQTLSKILNALQQTHSPFQFKLIHKLSNVQLVDKNHYYHLNCQYIKTFSNIQPQQQIQSLLQLRSTHQLPKAPYVSRIKQLQLQLENYRHTYSRSYCRVVLENPDTGYVVRYKFLKVTRIQTLREILRRKLKIGSDKSFHLFYKNEILREDHLFDKDSISI